MVFNILTIFPHILDSYINESILKRAQNQGLIKIKFWDLRDFTCDKRRSVDDTPYGGGPGMILQIMPIFKCLEVVLGIEQMKAKVQNLTSQISNVKDLNQKNPSLTPKIIMLSPKGEQFSQAKAKELAKLDRLVLICGRYEGVDARVEKLVDEQISIGPYVLSGGELPAIVVVEAVIRLLPGVLGRADSLCVESYNTNNTQNSTCKAAGDVSKHIIEYPQYTKPQIFEPIPGVKWRVPKVLVSGDHKKIAKWRMENMKL